MDLSNFNRKDYWHYRVIEHSFHSIIDETIRECFEELKNG